MIGGCVLLVGILAWKLCLVSSPAKVPALDEQWHQQAYGLDDNEVVRLIPPPYSPQRNLDGGAGQVWGQLLYDVTNHKTRIESKSSPIGTVASSIPWVLGWGLPYSPRVASLRMNDLIADGDWIVRHDAPFEQRIEALQSILRAATKEQIVFEISEYSILDPIMGKRWHVAVPMQVGRGK